MGFIAQEIRKFLSIPPKTDINQMGQSESPIEALPALITDQFDEQTINQFLQEVKNEVTNWLRLMNPTLCDYTMEDTHPDFSFSTVGTDPDLCDWSEVFDATKPLVTSLHNSIGEESTGGRISNLIAANPIAAIVSKQPITESIVGGDESSSIASFSVSRFPYHSTLGLNEEESVQWTSLVGRSCFNGPIYFNNTDQILGFDGGRPKHVNLLTCSASVIAPCPVNLSSNIPPSAFQHSTIRLRDWGVHYASWVVGEEYRPGGIWGRCGQKVYTIGSGEVATTLIEGECQILKLCGMSINPFSSESKALKLMGEITVYPSLILVNSGATHNLISKKLVRTLGLEMLATGPLRIRLVDGNRVWITHQCRNMSLKFGSFTCQVDASVYDMGSLDFIPRLAWLKQLGDVLFKWQTHELQFWQRDTENTGQSLELEDRIRKERDGFAAGTILEAEAVVGGIFNRQIRLWLIAWENDIVEETNRKNASTKQSQIFGFQA